LKNNGVLVAYGGGKDSSYAVAFARLMQLIFYKDYGSTFKLRVATNRHAGMPQAVMENINRAYHALQFYGDPNVEILLIDGNDVTIFNIKNPLPSMVREQNRTDILMTGHRCFGDGRPTFCNSCNLSMLNSFGIALTYGNGIDIVITGDSTDEQRAYTRWIRRLTGKFGFTERRNYKEFKSFLLSVNDISLYYFSDIYGNDPKQIEKHCIKFEGITRNPIFFSIYEDTAYTANEHWRLLVEYLRFEFDDLAFSFSESDCANPALMAHLRGLKAEYLYGRSYVEGIQEYVEFAVNLMKKKDFPDRLVELVFRRYNNQNELQKMREKVAQFCKAAYNLFDHHLICMIFSPFVECGKNMEKYFEAMHPKLLPRMSEIHALFSESPEIDANAKEFLVSFLFEVSGLSLAQLMVLYKKRSITNIPDSDSNDSPIAIIRESDPHKAIIETRHKPDGPIIKELITGR
jgi:hypothetical protein